MKRVKLLVKKGNNKAGAVVEYDDTSADWLVRNGYAEEVKSAAPSKDTKPARNEAAPTPRRGRPRKTETTT